MSFSLDHFGDNKASLQRKENWSTSSKLRPTGLKLKLTSSFIL